MCIVLRPCSWLLLGLSLASCTELVVLGDDCRRDSHCVIEADSDVTPDDIDAGTRSDGGSIELDANVVTPLDASEDASVDAYVPVPGDASFWHMPAIVNPSFNITGGEPGDVATLSVPTGTMITPWNSCLPLGVDQALLAGVRAETLVTYTDRNNAVRVFPQEGRSFIAMRYFVALVPPVLQQALKTPLRAGEHYGFAIDVLSSNPAANLSLRVYGGEQVCSLTMAATLLAGTDPIKGADWQTVCLRFTAPVDLPYLMLVENAPGAINDDLLFLDNIRSVEACPP